MNYQPFDTIKHDVEFVIISLFGGDNNLSHFVDLDLQEMAKGNRGNITVLALTDYETKPASVIEIAPDGKQTVLEELGEIDTGDPEVLRDFLVRAFLTYPHQRKALGFWDHGTGTFDEYDKDEKLLRSNRQRSYRKRKLFYSKQMLKDKFNDKGMLHDDTNGGVLTNLEAGKMLNSAFELANINRKIDLIYSDTCLNGMIEVVEELKDYAHCIVGSSDLEPGEGWNYELWFNKIGTHETTTPEDLGSHAIRAFEEHYKNKPDLYPCTLGAFKTDNEIVAAFKYLIKIADSLGMQGYYILDTARRKTQPFDRKDSYDLIEFCKQVSQLCVASNSTNALNAAAKSLRRVSIDARVDYTAMGDTVQRSEGIAFWFPSNRRVMSYDKQTYKKLAFNKTTGWTDYLDEWM